MAEDRIDEARKRLRQYMTEQGKKNTRQRDVIVEVFLQSEGHLTLQELQAKVQSQIDGVGFATVYRTMKLLVDAKVAVERHFGTSQTLYELAEFGDHHDHLICISCHTIIEFEDPAIEKRQDEIAKEFSFKVVRHRHEIYGICASCQD